MNRNQWTQTHAQGLDIDAGLRSHMISIYNYMGLGLALTGLVAFLAASSPALMQTIFMSPLKWVVMLAPLGVVFYLSSSMNRIAASTAQTLFWVYAGLMGLSLSSLFYVFTLSSIARVFFITASVFGSMSIYGYTTKRDLTSMGSFLIMGVWGVFLASIVNLFLQSSGMQFGISILCVLIFTGLTAYDTQTLKSMYFENDDAEVQNKKAIFGALNLYLNFINIFISLLHLFGDRK